MNIRKERERYTFGFTCAPVRMIPVRARPIARFPFFRVAVIIAVSMLMRCYV